MLPHSMLCVSRFLDQYTRAMKFDAAANCAVLSSDWFLWIKSWMHGWCSLILVSMEHPIFPI